MNPAAPTAGSPGRSITDKPSWGPATWKDISVHRQEPEMVPALCPVPARKPGSSWPSGGRCPAAAQRWLWTPREGQPIGAQTGWPGATEAHGPVDKHSDRARTVSPRPVWPRQCPGPGPRDSGILRAAPTQGEVGRWSLPPRQGSKRDSVCMHPARGLTQAFLSPCKPGGHRQGN